MSEAIQPILDSAMAAVAGCGAVLLLALRNKLRDRLLTFFVVAACACAFGYLVSHMTWPLRGTGVYETALRERISTSFYIVFCGLIPWIWHRLGRFQARPLLTLTTLSSALLLAFNLSSRFSLRYLTIGQAGEAEAQTFELSGWIFTLASLVCITALISASSAAESWRDRGWLPLVTNLTATVLFAASFLHDLAFRDSLGSRLSFEGLGMLAMAVALFSARMHGAIRFAHLAEKEQAKELDAAFEMPTCLAFILDQHGVILKIERDASGLFSKFVGECLWTHPAFNYDERVANRIAKVISDMSGVSRSRLRISAQYSEEDERWLDLSFQRVADQDAGRTFILAEARDVTQLKQQQESLGSILQARSGSQEASSVIISRFSHELRTPLTPILGFSDLLLSDSRIPPDLRAHVRTIRDSADTLSERIRCILDTGSWLVEDFELHRDTCDSMQILQTLEYEARDRVSRTGKDIEIQVRLSELRASHFISDEAALLEILRKLIDNAIRFTAKGVIELAVDCNSDLSLDITVSDTGPGISEDQLERIFEPFYQDTSRTGNDVGGLGLGLTIARNLAVQIGATLTARPNLNAESGSAFTLALGKGSSILPVEEIGDFGDYESFDKRVVLLVEDDDATREFLSRFLNSRGFTVLATSNGTDAQDEIDARRESIDLLLLDMRLPDINGFDLAKAIRKSEYDEERIPMPIIAITAMAQDERDRSLCLEAGCSDYISKPVRASELLRKINTLIPRTTRIAAIE